MANEGETNDHQNHFDIDLDQCVDLVEDYRNRKFDEDLNTIKNKFGGIEGLGAKLKTDIHTGLKGDDFEIRDDVFGSNTKEKPKRTGFCKLFFMAMDDLMLKILLVSATISIVVSMAFADADERSIAWVEGVAILVAVFVVTIVTAWNDYKKEEQFMKLTAYSDAQNNVTSMRGGEEVEINVDDIKVGDLISIKTGMSIPADCILVQGTGVTTDESAMTGESIELKKEVLDQCEVRLEEKLEEEKFHGGQETRTNHDIPSPILLSGTQIETGEGWLMMIVVGRNSCVGKIFAKLSQEIEATPLQIKLTRIATDIGYLGMIAAGITLFVLFARFFIETGIDGYNWSEDIGDHLKEWFDYLLIAVTIVVVAVPEGLPLAVMIALAYSVRKMLKDMNFVKRLASCEIMGGANNICSDKTGTLTKNIMTVKEIWQGEVRSLDPEKSNYSMNDVITNQKTATLFYEACACNTSGTSLVSGATEKAILQMLDKFGCNYQEMRAKHCKDPLVRFQFTSKRKKMSTVLTEIKDNQYAYDKRLHVKGAAEIVLSHCSHYINAEGHTVELGEEMKNFIIKEVIENFAKGALRTICLAYKDLRPNEGGITHEDDDEDGINKVVEKMGLTCIGVLGIRDIIRPEVPDAVRTCRKAGIRVRMVTGDNKITALAIAKECGIIDEVKEECVLTGPEFYERVGGLYCKNCDQDSPCKCDEKKVKEAVRNNDEFIKIWKNLDVLARSRPEDKYLLVTGLRELGEIVAVTGDGTNDAPALKKADVGFAMGITGTDVAKHAADIILLDDNFASIVKACMWGRNIYDNIRRFLQFQLSVNIVALAVAFIGSCILRESPLQPIQLLWVNLIMDSLGSLAEATEPPTEDLLDRPPHGKDEYIISHTMVRHLIIMGTYQTIVIFLIIFMGEYFVPEDPDFKYNREDKYVGVGRAYDWNGDEIYKKYEDDEGASRHYTVVFNAFVYMQIFNMINSRKIHDELNVFEGIFNNATFLVIFFAISIIQAIIVQLTQDVFRVSRDGLWWGQWLFCLAVGLTVFPVNFLTKFVPNKWCPSIGGKKKNKKTKVGDQNTMGATNN
jgi:Ca2+ transporting ATPase